MNGLPWFRMYHEFATDPKVQMLSEADQRRFVMVLCFRCCNGDVTLHDADVAFQLRISDAEWSDTKARLIAKKLIDSDNIPTNWDKRQKASDSSKSRVYRHRARKAEKPKRECSVTETVQSKIESKIEIESNPQTPTGASGEVVPFAKPFDPRTAFTPADENLGVVVGEGGTVQLVGKTRDYWFAEFGRDAKRLDLALRQITIQPGSRIPVQSQVERALARQAADKLDRDQRYQSAATASKTIAKPVRPSRW